MCTGVGSKRQVGYWEKVAVIRWKKHIHMRFPKEGDEGSDFIIIISNKFIIYTHKLNKCC